MREYTYAEIKQSRIISEKKAPKFGVILFLLFLGLIIITIGASAVTTKTYIVEFDALVSGSSISNLTNKTTGTISKIYVEEGDEVDAGDLLFELDSSEITSQIQQLENTLQYIDMKVDLTLLLIKYINEYTLSNSATLVIPFASANLNEGTEYSYASQFHTYVQEESLTQSEIDNIKASYVVNHYESYDEYMFNKTETESSIEFLNESKSDYQVRASMSGIVRLNGHSEGEVILIGTNLGEIENINPANLFIGAYISVTDKNRLNIDDEVVIEVGGLNNSDFNKLEGEIISISDETIIIDGIAYFYITIQPLSTTLKDSEGNIVDLTANMTTHCVIKYNETSWLQWGLKQLGVEFK